MYIYVNGDFVLEQEAKISPFDHGFLYGLGVFETFRTYDGHPFLLGDHFQRLSKSLESLNIQLSLSIKDVKEIIDQLLIKNNIRNAYVRLNISAGNAPVGLQLEPYTNPTIICFIKPMAELVATEKNAVILKTRRNSPEGQERLKSHHYLNNIYGKREMLSPIDEGIFLTKEGFIAEGVISNVFWVKNKQVYTPAIETGILNGITRQFVLFVLAKLNIPFQEGFYCADDLLSADEVFVTNSIQEIVSINSIDGKLYENKEKANFLRSIYKRAIEQNILSKEELAGRLSFIESVEKDRL